MKKVLFLIITLLFLIPISTYASDVKITGIDINGKDSVVMGEKITLSFKIRVSGLEKKSNSLGMLYAGFKIDFDPNVLVPVDIDSPGFDSDFYTENTNSSNYYIIGIVKDNTSYNKECVGGLLFCDDYQVTVPFYARSVVGEEPAKITISEAAIAVLDMVEDREYTDDDVQTITSNITKTKEIKLLESSAKVEPPPASIVESSKPKTTTTTKKKTNKSSSSTSSTTTSSTNKNSKKSSNNNLKSLTIDDYKIDFKKEQHLYSIDLVNNANKLIVKAATEDKKATYKIIGADDLKKNDYKVKIEVTAENGDKSTYSITVYKQEDKKEEKKKFLVDLNIKKDDLIKYGIIGGVVVLIIIIISLIIHHKDHKLEKSLDEL